MSSDLANEETTVPCLLIRHQEHPVSNAQNLIKKHTITAQTVSECVCNINVNFKVLEKKWV
jgi:hypothetical protein